MSVIERRTGVIPLSELVCLLQRCVDEGASIGFWPPLSAEEAGAYWADVQCGVDAGQTLLLLAWQAGVLAGTVQLQLESRPNGRHRAELCKLMVDPSCRRSGVGRALVAAAEAWAIEAGRTLLLLDTRTGDRAEALYVSMDYVPLGRIDDYVQEADGRRMPTSVFYKHLGQAAC